MQISDQLIYDIRHIRVQASNRTGVIGHHKTGNNSLKQCCLVNFLIQLFFFVPELNKPPPDRAIITIMVKLVSRTCVNMDPNLRGSGNLCQEPGAVTSNSKYCRKEKLPKLRGNKNEI